jgi:uncharacterized iron-regulated protein
MHEQSLTCRQSRSGVNLLRIMPAGTVRRIAHTPFAVVSLCAFLSSLLPAEAGASSEKICSEAAAGGGWQTPAVVAVDQAPDFETLIVQLAQSRVVFVGESHDRYDHHLNQLEIICRLYRRDPRMVIAMEFFQQPFQADLDDFIAGRIDTEDMVRATEYYNRWRFDYRLYKPIMDFARDRGIPVLALNVPSEITSKVGIEGIDSLSEDERARLPVTIDRADKRYRERIRIAFEAHAEETRGEFEQFFEVQLAWDEGMAKRIARFLIEHPEDRLVVLAGTGHVIRSGIPARVIRRAPAVSVSVVLQSGSDETPSIDGQDGDYALVSKLIELPPAGMLGAFLGSGGNGVSVQSFGDDSAAAQAGIRKGDRIVALEGNPVSDFAGLKMGLLDKRPGDTVTVKVERETGDGSTEILSYEVTLR